MTHLWQSDGVHNHAYDRETYEGLCNDSSGPKFSAYFSAREPMCLRCLHAIWSSGPLAQSVRASGS